MPERKYPEVYPGQVINAWTVIEYSHHAGCHRMFTCRCECGEIKEVSECNLNKGASPHCLLCRTRKQALKRVNKNLNKKFGSLVVKKVFKEEESDNWIVACDCKACGKKDHILSLHSLHSGTKTCGCSRHKGSGRLPPPSVKNGKKARDRTIDDRDRQIVKMKLGGSTMTDIGASLNITKQRVQQLLKRLTRDERNTIINEMNKANHEES